MEQPHNDDSISVLSRLRALLEKFCWLFLPAVQCSPIKPFLTAFVLLLISPPTHLADTPAQNSFAGSHVDPHNHWSWGRWWESVKGTWSFELAWVKQWEQELLHQTASFQGLHRETLGGKTIDVFLEETSVSPQDSPHHPYMLMPPCQWRHITITAPPPITRCNTYIIYSPYPFSQVHSYPFSLPVSLCLCHSQLFTILWNVLQCPASTE